MCGIVGYVGHRPVVNILIEGLRRLEYRGYDSAGVAFFHNGKLEIKKAEGKLQNVEKLLTDAKNFSDATSGIGHTRWATHGKPTTQNAHPHRTGHVVLVHNGIIENYQSIKKEIIARGHAPQTETDSELFGFLVLENMEDGMGFSEAVRKAFLRLEGQCSVVVMSEKEPGVVIGVRNGSPLVAAVDPQGGALLASDAHPILNYTREVYFLETGDMVVGTLEGVEFIDIQTGKRVERRPSFLDWTIEKIDKRGYEHFMLKEIEEQPTAFVDTLNGILDRAKLDAFPLAQQFVSALPQDLDEIHLVACGSAWHAALVGKYWLEKWARVRTNVELASEFRYRKPVLSKKSVVIGISQSGETADTLAALREGKKSGVLTIAITNSRGSTLSREADLTFYTSAGPEISVAGTKSFLTQMEVLLLLSGWLAAQRKTTSDQELTHFFEDVIRIPHILAACLESGSELVQKIKLASEKTQNSKGFFFIGRGYSFPLALEGALKLKEIAYYHAEGYASGELKHGPIAMIEEGMTLVVLAPKDIWRDKTVSNLEEVKARGAKVIGVGEGSDQALKALCDYWIPLPEVKGRPIEECLNPFLLTPVMQLLSYELAVLRGTDVDRPRNLAKSVTVE